LLFFHGFRLGERGERVKINFVFSFERIGEKAGFIGENEGKIFETRTTGEVQFGVLSGETWLAKDYLGLQGTWHEREGMGKGEGTLSGREVVESDFRRNGDSSINSAVQSITGRLDEV
jgi:hypothetical protein